MSNAMNSEMFNVKLKRPVDVVGYPDYQLYSCQDSFSTQDRYEDFDGGKLSQLFHEVIAAIQWPNVRINRCQNEDLDIQFEKCTFLTKQ